MSAILISAVTGLIGKAIDLAVPDKNEAQKLKASVTAHAVNLAQSELQGAIQIITAEANGESWLQRNWRPLVMLSFTALVGAHWLGFTPANLSESQVLGLLDIVQIGIAGYVVGRSGEKIMREYKK